MQTPKEHIQLLWNRYLTNDLTQAELDILLRYIDEAPAGNFSDWDFIGEQILTEEAGQAGFTGMDEDRKALLISNVLTGDLKSVTGNSPSVPYFRAPVHRVHFLKTAWSRYAAALIFLLAGTAVYLYVNKAPGNNIATDIHVEKPVIVPGGNKAILTLADGSTIVLDSAASGAIAHQGNTRIIKLDAGALAYNTETNAHSGAELLYNTISTPRGGQYQVILQDGSKVWLNAASSIRFPTVFEKNRNVAITGEAYFEIKTSAASPFHVSVNGMEIQVLGTSFNVNAYADEESVKTTLVTGSVRISAFKKSQTIIPGQQLSVFPSGEINTRQSVDLEAVLAWKNGFFNLEGARVPEVMRQLSRWYDIDVIYEKGIPDITFFGEMSRNTRLSDLLGGLEVSGVHYKMEGRRLIILQK